MDDRGSRPGAFRQLLLLAPHFAPTNAADGQRARLYLRHFRANGWQPTVLAVAPHCVHAPLDAFLEAAIPDDVEVRRIVVPTSRWLGDTLARRALWPLGRALTALLAERRFDLAYLSTTQFACFALGPAVLRRRGVPYVLDLQDPWRNDYYRRSGVAPPGGRLRHALAGLEARLLEPWCVRGAAGFTSVSADYPQTLQSRYGSLAPALLLPFGYDRDDAARVAAQPRDDLPFDPADGRRHWVYVGRGGRDMHAALAPLFAALARRLAREPDLPSRLRLHFIGTSYAAADRASGSLAEPIAAHGLGALVLESPERVSYRLALQAMQAAAVLLVPSSDDASYNPSKLFASLALARPTLLLAGAGSHAAKAVGGVDGVRRLGGDTDPGEADRWVDDFLAARVAQPDPSAPAIAAMEAERLCAALCRYFDERLAASR